MAGDWIKMRVNLATDPAVKAMARALKIDAFSVVGRLHVVWAWAGEHTENGEIPWVTLGDVDDLVSLSGFAAQMQAVGWLNDLGEAIRLPNFDRHNGEGAKRRVMETEKKRKQRDCATTPPPCPDSVPENQGQKGDIVPEKTGPEKRREEKRVNTIPPTPSGGGGKEDAKKDARHHAITSQWGELYRGTFQCTYTFNGRDAAALSRFLLSCKDDADTIMQVAREAWGRTRSDRFAGRCKEAATIHGLCRAYNDIRVQLAAPTGNGANNGTNPHQRSSPTAEDHHRDGFK